MSAIMSESGQTKLESEVHMNDSKNAASARAGVLETIEL
ncbi:hypothetical protein SAMN05421787_106174 [Virgibacillus pantothenticus]|nr:hypothetical protein SAMN05421787_106174 [Virgibacillus pantothenticus]